MGIIFTVLLLLAALLIWLHFSSGNRFRRIPVTLINQVKEGDYVKIHGVAIDNGAQVKGSLSQQACLVYTVMVEEKDGNNWRTVIETSWGDNFFVRDHTGKVLVRFYDTEPILNESARFSNSMFRRLPEHVIAYLHRSGKSTKGLLGEKIMRGVECAVFAGDDVMLSGYAHWKKKGTPEEYLVLKKGRRRLYLTNTKDWLQRK